MLDQSKSSNDIELNLQSVLIVGAAGKIGSSLRDYLGKYYNFRCLDIQAIPDIADMIIADVNDFAAVLQAMQEIDTVIHLAANPSPYQGWHDVYTSGIQGTYNVFEAARQAGVKKIIYASSCYVSKGWGINRKKLITVDDSVRPNSLYGVGKAVGETLGYYYADNYQLSVICLRIGVFGTYSNVQQTDDWHASMWCSSRDFAQLIQCILEKENLGFQIFYAISNNSNKFVDIGNALKIVDYNPQDDINKYYRLTKQNMIKQLIIDKLNIPEIIYPTEQQKLLLKAALLPQEDALKAWNQWYPSAEINSLDSDSNQLLALLYRNFSQSNIELANQDKLKGIYRHNWTNNQIKLPGFFSILEQLSQAGIEAIHLNTPTLVYCYYKDYGSRPINSFSLMIKPADFLKVSNVLSSLGWQSQQNELAIEDNSVVNKIFYKDNLLLYLLSRIFWAIPQDHTDNQIWQQAKKIKVDNYQIYLISPTDQFLVLCLQAHYNPIPALIHWLTDCMIILQSAETEIDWVRLVTQAQRYQLILPLRNMLSFLNHLLGISIPDWVFPSLYTMPISDHELVTYYVPPGNKLLKLKSLLLILAKKVKF